MESQSIRYLIKTNDIEIITPYLHSALALINTNRKAKLYDARTGRLLDTTEPYITKQVQSVLSQTCDKLNLPHMRLEQITDKGGPYLEEAVFDAIDRQNTILEQGKELAYIQALSHFFLIQLAKERKD